MTTLTIADLSVTKTLDEAAMTKMTGGWSPESAFNNVGYWHTDPNRLIWSYNISYYPPLH